MSDEPKGVQRSDPEFTRRPPAMSLYKRRYVFSIKASHCPSRTNAKFQIPADSEFEAEAILERLLRGPTWGVTGDWGVGVPICMETAEEESAESMEELYREFESGS